MPVYNLIEYSDNYSKTSGSLWQCYRDEPSVNDDSVINNFTGNNASFKFKQKITKQELTVVQIGNNNIMIDGQNIFWLAS